ncbi:Ionotropic receptor 215 [Blattella germanica]|nr:Ionotropic receptor 215 [Blattella germanica]
MAWKYKSIVITLRCFVISMWFVEQVSCTEVQSELLRCLQNIAFNYFKSEDTIVVSFKTKSDFSASESIIFLDTTDVLLKGLTSLEVWSVKVISYQNFDCSKFELVMETNSNYVLSINSRIERIIIEDINHQLTALKRCRNWNPRTSKFIIIANNYFSRETAAQILARLWKYNILNAIVFMEASHKEITISHNTEVGLSTPLFDIFTWFPYSPPGRCADVSDAILLNRWITDGKMNGRFISNTSIFPNKIPDVLYGCQIVVSSFNFPPFAVENKSLKLTSIEARFDDGVLVSLLDIILRKLNITARYIKTSERERWGTRIINTTNGIIGEVIRHESDMALNLYCNVCHLYFDIECSFTYYVDQMRWFIPCPNLRPRWLSILDVFKTSTWLIFLMTYLVMSIIMSMVEKMCNKVTRKQARNKLEYLSISLQHFGEIALFGGTYLSPTSRFATRSIFLTWIIFTVAINNVFQSFLTSFFVEQGQDTKITTERQLQQSTFELVVNPDVAGVFQELKDGRYKLEYCKSHKPCEEFYDFKGDVAYLKMSVNMAYIAAKYHGETNKNEVVCHIDDIFVSLPLTLPFTKGFVLLEKVNKILMKAVDSGILYEIWELFLFKTAIYFKHESDDSTYVTFTLQHLKMAFICLLSGYSLSLIIFITETLLSRNRSYRYTNK